MDPGNKCRDDMVGPGTNIPEAAADLIEKLNAQLGYTKQAAE